MRYRYLSDSHCHTDCSFDGHDSVMMLCDNAARQGLFSLTVTDHCECQDYWEKEYKKAILQSYFEARKAAAAFRSKLHVYAGIDWVSRCRTFLQRKTFCQCATLILCLQVFIM